MGSLIDRTEFRAVLKEVVNCMREHLAAPGVPELTAEQIMFWWQNVTLEDVTIVVRQIETDKKGSGR